MVRNRQEVIQAIQVHRSEIQKFGVKRLGLFGSVARGEGGETSDLDFVVELERKTFDDYMGLKIFLEEVFHCPVDLVLTHSVKPRLRARISQETIYVPGL